MVKVKLEESGKFSKREVALLNKKCAEIIKESAYENGIDEQNIELDCGTVSIRKNKPRSKRGEKTVRTIKAIGLNESIEKYLLEKHNEGALKEYNVKDIFLAAQNSGLLELSLDSQKRLVDKIIENRALLNDRNLNDIALVVAKENQLNPNAAEHLYSHIIISASNLHEGLQQYINIAPDVSKDQSQYLNEILTELNNDIKEVIK